MKRFLSVFVVIILLLSLAACSTQNGASPSQSGEMISSSNNASDYESQLNQLKAERDSLLAQSEELESVKAERDALESQNEALKSLLKKALANYDEAKVNEIINAAIDSTEEMQEALLAQGKKRIHIGETIQGDNCEITFINLKTTKSIYIDSFYGTQKPEEGCTFAVLTINVLNKTDTPITLWELSGLNFYADNNFYMKTRFGYIAPRIDGYNELNSDVLIEPGRAYSGYVLCEIPQTSKHIEIEYDGITMECDL